MKTTYRTPAYKGQSIPVVQSRDVNLGMIIGAGQHVNPANNTKIFNLCIVDLDSQNNNLTLIPLNFFGHGITPNPVKPELLTVFEKRGKGACEVNLQTGSVTRTINTKEKQEYYGHGAYSRDGSLLYCTETVVEGNYEGLIAVRDATSHEYLGEFPSFGASPHDCHLIDDGNTMVITNGGGSSDGSLPNVAFVDVHEAKLLDKREFSSSTINAGHLDITASGKLAVVSAQRQGLPDTSHGGITLLLPNGNFLTLTEPKKVIDKLVGETLSVKINEPGNIVGTTTPAGNLLAFWDLETGQLIKHYELQNPRGIELTHNGEFFVVSYGLGSPPEALCLISSKTLEKVTGYDLSPTGITGSHLLNYTLPEDFRTG